MFRGGTGPAGGPAGSAAPPPGQPMANGGGSGMMSSFGRLLGMGRPGQQQQSSPPAAAPPMDLPNPQTPNNDNNLVFYVDDSLSEVARVRRYALSQLPLQRLVYVKRIAACARSIGLSETLTQLLPLFPKLVTDQEAVVRTATASELANMAYFLADPHLPYTPHVQSNSVRQQPTTAQGPDPTLEDDNILDLDDHTTDVTNDLPSAITLTSEMLEGVTAAGNVDVDTAGKTTGNGTSTADEESSMDGDAMDVDSIAGVPASTINGDSRSGESDEHDASNKVSVSDDDNEAVPMDETTDESDVDESTTSADESSQAQSNESPGTSAAEDQGEVKPEDDTASIPAEAPSSSSAPSSSANATSTSTSSNSPPLSSSTVPSPPLAPLTVPSPSQSASSSSALSTPTSTNSTSRPPSPDSDPFSVLRVECMDQIKETVVPCLQTLILDNNAEVRAAACDALVRVADVLRGDDVGKVVLTLVLNLAHDERDDQRTTAVHLMHELAPRLGHDLCRSFVALELIAFADDATFRVRKATAQSFGNVCEMVGEQFTVAKLLPQYVRLSKDLIWGVRKGCVESLVAVTKAVGPQARSEVIIPMFERFIKDSSRWVRTSAYEILGPFLYALGPSLVSRELLSYFTSIPSLSSAIVDQDVNFQTAFNLPAVLTTIGRDRWDELHACFHALVKDSKFPVRRTLSYSLHEVAHLLGPQLSEQSLLPALDSFLRDLDEVRYGVLKNFASILRSLPAATRVQYMEVLWLVQKQNDNWRWRMLWAKQLGAFAHLYDAQHVVRDILPMACALCRDGVAAVRRTAAKAMGRVLKRVLSFSTPNAALQPFIQYLQSFTTRSSYMERQLYLRVIDGCAGQLSSELFEQMLAAAIPLATDNISNVRLACAQSMRLLLQHHTPLITHSEAARTIIQTLTEDSHLEVKRCIFEALHHAQPQLQAAATSALTSSLASLTLALSTANTLNTTPGLSPTGRAAPPSTELTDEDLSDILGEEPPQTDAAAQPSHAPNTQPQPPGSPVAAAAAVNTPPSPQHAPVPDAAPVAGPPSPSHAAEGNTAADAIPSVSNSLSTAHDAPPSQPTNHVTDEHDADTHHTPTSDVADSSQHQLNEEESGISTDSAS